MAESDLDTLVNLLEKAVVDGRTKPLVEMLLTLDEINSVVLRIDIIKHLLDNKMPQRQIKEQLKTSAATITRGSNMLKQVPKESIEWFSHQMKV